MYEKITAFLPNVQNNKVGEWVIDHKDTGSQEKILQFPFVTYSPSIMDFEREVYCFIEEHKGMGLNHYYDILKNADIRWDKNSMKSADVTKMDGRTVLALIVGAIRADRFCEGALLNFCRDGSIAKWLSRLKEIDEES